MRRVRDAVIEVADQKDVETAIARLQAGEVTTFRGHRGWVIEVKMTAKGANATAKVVVRHSGRPRCGCETYGEIEF